MRLRARFPDLKIVVGRWGLAGGLEKNREQLLASGAVHVGTTLRDTCHQVLEVVQVIRNSDRPEVSAFADSATPAIAGAL
jgi:hypothetical protein